MRRVSDASSPPSQPRAFAVGTLDSASLETGDSRRSRSAQRRPGAVCVDGDGRRHPAALLCERMEAGMKSLLEEDPSELMGLEEENDPMEMIGSDDEEEDPRELMGSGEGEDEEEEPFDLMDGEEEEDPTELLGLDEEDEDEEEEEGEEAPQAVRQR